MFYQLPPVGNPVLLDTSKNLADVPEFSSYKTHYFASGTAALAAALISAKTMNSGTDHGRGRGEETKKGEAEVIFPAYGCPDLISAAVFAGVKPVLVDLEADSPWLDLSLLQAAITENTIAIVAVDLFGIAERWTQLRAIAEQHDLVLIEDSAQYFPGRNNERDWQGDIVILSFGRGKPVSLLGGGSVLIKTALVKTERAKLEMLYAFLPKPVTKPTTLHSRFLFGLKARVYNVMISPYLYWLPQVLPFLHLGETRYHPLLGIDAMDQLRLDTLASNISRYQQDDGALTRSNKISSVLCSSGKVNNLPLIKDIEVNTRLLRYPLLLEEASRDRIYGMLKQAGLGVSIMYPASLPNIIGLEHILDSKEFKNAEAFAARILTLPTHRYVSDKVIAKLKAIFEKSG